MFLKELIKIIKFKKNEINYNYCFYVENKNIFFYLKNYILKKSIKHKVLIFSNEKIESVDNPNIYNLCIKNKFLNYVFFKYSNFKYLYSSTPDLNNSNFVKSVKKCKYIYLQHSPVSLTMAYNSKAFNNFDAVQTINKYQFNELDLINKKFNIKVRPFKSKYAFLELNNKNINKKKKLLIAPTWNTNFYKRNIHENLFRLFEKNKIDYEFRPHYMSVKKNEINLNKYDKSILNIDNYVDLRNYENLISDWSGIYFEFAILNKRKPMLIDTKKKINNNDYTYQKHMTIEETYRDLIGHTIKEENLEKCVNIINSSNQAEERLINEFINKIFY